MGNKFYFLDRNVLKWGSVRRFMFGQSCFFMNIVRLFKLTHEGSRLLKAIHKTPLQWCFCQWFSALSDAFTELVETFAVQHLFLYKHLDSVQRENSVFFFTSFKGRDVLPVFPKVQDIWGVCVCGLIHVEAQ